MRSLPSEAIAKDVLPVWRIRAGLEALVFAILPIGYVFLSDLYNWPVWIMITFVIIYIVFFITHVFIFPYLKWKYWRYEVLETEIDLLRGVFIVKRTLIPMNRVQHVDTEQGPLLRKYRLAAITISTAATIHQIPALSMEDADSLRDQIAKLAIVADDDENDK